MKCDQEQVTKLLTDTVTLLCKNGLVYGKEMTVQGLLGITVDKCAVFLVHMNELIGVSMAAAAPLVRKKNTASSSSDQQRISKLLTETVTLLCRNGLAYRQEMKVQGLLGITVDKNEVCLVHINELIGANVSYERSNMASSPASSNVVDLTRLADSPDAAKQSVGSPVSPGQVTARRMHCPLLPTGPPRPPSSMMMSKQQASPRTQHGLHPRMMNPTSRSRPMMQHRMPNQFASNYMPQLHQQVGRGMSPGRMMSLPRQKPMRPHIYEPVPSHTYPTANDDDVLIVGTGHEEPSPSWGSPMRKRPLPSATSSSPARKRPSFQPSDDCSPSFQGFPSVIDQLSSGNVAGELELSADDVPSCIEDMIMEIAPITVPAAHKDANSTLLLSGDSAAANDELSSASTEDSVAMMQPDTVDMTAVVSDDAGELVTNSEPSAAENMTHNNTESFPPVVYTDIACDVEDAGNAETQVATTTPEEFSILTWDALSSDERKHWRCHAVGCMVVCSEASDLANHYSVVHSRSLDMSILPTVIAPANSEDEMSVSEEDESSEQQCSDVNRWPGISCPFPGCALSIASYPGMVMHHRRVHGVPLPAKQRRAIAMVYRARRLDAEISANAAAEGATSVPETMSSTAVSDSFVCPFNSCGVSCVTREDLVAHVHLSHQPADVMLPPICKQEAPDDSTSA